MIDATALERLGVYLDPADNQYKRSRVRTRSVTYDPADPKAELKGLALSYTQERVPHPVILPLATDPESVEEARQKAVRAGADFWHPTHGWLRGGVKREAEAPENLGRGSVVYPTEEIRMAPASVTSPAGEVPASDDVDGVDVPAAERKLAAAPSKTRPGGH